MGGSVPVPIKPNPIKSKRKCLEEVECFWSHDTGFTEGLVSIHSSRAALKQEILSIDVLLTKKHTCFAP